MEMNLMWAESEEARSLRLGVIIRGFPTEGESSGRRGGLDLNLGE